MCLWLLTACLGLLPANPSSSQTTVVVVGAPAPILLPVANTTTTAATTTTTTARPGNMTGAMTPPPGTAPPNTSATNPPASTPPGSPPPTNTSQTPPPPPAITTVATNTSPTTMPSPPATTTPATNTSPTPPSPPGSNMPPPAPGPNMPAPNMPTGVPPPMIDPRLGTTAAAYNVPPITGYNALPYDTAVKFPREKRSLRREVVPTTEDYLEHKQARVKRQMSGCSCVPAGTCHTQGYPSGMIDFRIVTQVAGQCASGQVYCCTGGNNAASVACGTRQTVAANLAVSAGQAEFGEYPWMAIILTNQNDYIAGGVLIDQYNVLTVVHRLLPYVVAGAAPNVKVRLGEWDAAGTYEPIPYQEYTVQRVFTHPSFNSGTLQYDIAVLRLSRPVPFSAAAGFIATINRACLPASSASTYNGQRCWVTGWGKNAFGTQGQYQQILKKVDVPIVEPSTCETQLRTARLGASYVLDRTSFLCAGGEVNKDSCTGDGGSGLVCQVNGQWVLVGLVAWGLGCASSNVPGVYVNIATLLPWIQQQVATT